MLFAGREYSRLGWAMQLHYGCKRDNNSPMYQKLGPDTGYDCINNYAPSGQMADFLNALNETGELPKTIIYSLTLMTTKPSERSSAASRIPLRRAKIQQAQRGGSMITRPA